MWTPGYTSFGVHTAPQHSTHEHTEDSYNQVESTQAKGNPPSEASRRRELSALRHHPGLQRWTKAPSQRRGRSRHPILTGRHRHDRQHSDSLRTLQPIHERQTIHATAPKPNVTVGHARHIKGVVTPAPCPFPLPTGLSGGIEPIYSRPFFPQGAIWWSASFSDNRITGIGID